MRNLVINREKSFLGCLAKFRVYIEDPTSKKPKINGKQCRLLGTIKNGEQKAFAIPDDACRIYVVPETLFKNLITELFDIPAGEADIYLTGKCQYGAAGTVMFRFDQISSQEQLDNRKKGGKNTLIYIAICFIVGMIIGVAFAFIDVETEPMVFTESNMEITLTDGFYEADYDSFDATYSSDEVLVMVVQEEFTLAEGAEELTLKEYAEIVLESNDLGRLPINEEDGLLWYEYTYDDGGYTYYYYSYVYKSADSFWIVQFCVDETMKDEYKDTITQYAKSVKFN